MKCPMKLEWQLHYSDRIEDSFSFIVLVLHGQWSVMKKEINVVDCGMMSTSVEYVMEDCFIKLLQKSVFLAGPACWFQTLGHPTLTDGCFFSPQVLEAESSALKLLKVLLQDNHGASFPQFWLVMMIMMAGLGNSRWHHLLWEGRLPNLWAQ